jgi:hypothetical protein
MANTYTQMVVQIVFAVENFAATRLLLSDVVNPLLQRLGRDAAGIHLPGTIMYLNLCQLRRHQLPLFLAKLKLYIAGYLLPDIHFLNTNCKKNSGLKLYFNFVR